MFRVNQSLTLPKNLDAILSRFKSVDTVTTIRTNRDLPKSQTIEITLSYPKRRRRARRLAGTVGNLRTTWF